MFVGQNMKPAAISPVVCSIIIIVVVIIFIILAALGLLCCVRVFSTCGEWGLLFIVMHRLLIVVASLVAEHGP